MAFTTPVDTSTPVGGQSVSLGDDRIRESKVAWQEVLDVDHEMSFTGTEIDSVDSGCHNKVTFIEQGADPTAPAGLTTNFGILYTKDDSDTSQSELFWRDENDNILQITKGQTLDLDLNYLSNDTYLEGTNFAGSGSIGMIKIDTSDQVEIYHSITKPATLADASPPLVDKDIANMKYVDDQIDATVGDGAFDPLLAVGGNASNGEITFPNGIQMKWGKSDIPIATLDNVVTFTTEGLTAFDNACFNVTVTLEKNTESYSHYGEVRVKDLTATSFTVWRYAGGTANTIYWFAIGR